MLEFILKNWGTFPGAIAIIGLGLYIWFDIKYKSQLENNHFGTITRDIEEVGRKITALHKRLDDEEKERAKEDKAQSERIARLETSLEYINKKLEKINGFK